MITVFGATGYTGQLIANALERRGLPYRLAGRSSEKLAALSRALPSRPAYLVADGKHSASLAALFKGTRLLVNCVGPFTDLGEPVVALAAAHGTHYVDITNELAYVYRLGQYAPLAAQTGAAIIPACGFEVAISDCAIACLTRDRPASVDSVDIIYGFRAAGISVGTRLSALRSFATSWLGYRGGEMVGRAPGAAVRRGTFSGRPYSAVSFPSAEVVTVPAHTAAQNVQAWLAVSRLGAGLIALSLPLVGLLLRTPLRWVAAQIVKNMAPPPRPEARVKDQFTIQIEIAGAGADAVQLWTGRDPYGLTAEIIAYAAAVLTSGAAVPAGVLAPAQVLNPDQFTRWLREQAGVSLRGETA